MAWLNRIADPAMVVDTLLDLLQSSPHSIQKEIISQLPGLVSDREQVRVAFALCELLDSNAEGQQSLTGAVLDALGDLQLPSIEAVELRAKVVKRLLTVPLETVPVLLNFSFKRIGTDESVRLIREVRQSFDRAFKNKQRRGQTDESLHDCLSLAVEALQGALIRSKALADTWFKGTFCPSYRLFSNFMTIIPQRFKGNRTAGITTALIYLSF